MSKYSIYKLCCKNPEITNIYVGSTKNFTRRKHQHKNNCINENAKNIIIMYINLLENTVVGVIGL